MMHDVKLVAALPKDAPVRPEATIGPLGEKLTREMLPPPDTRWTPRRKAEVVAAVHGGLIDVTEACKTYNISLEEFDTWARGIAKAGLRALRATHLQTYRRILASDI